MSTLLCALAVIWVYSFYVMFSVEVEKTLSSTICVPVKFLRTTTNSHMKVIATFFSSVCFWPLGYLLFSVVTFGFSLFLLTSSSSACSHCNFFVSLISLFLKDREECVLSIAENSVKTEWRKGVVIPYRWPETSGLLQARPQPNKGCLLFHIFAVSLVVGV